jgi:hypothetical protein
MDFKPYFEAYPALEVLYFVGGEVFTGQNAENDSAAHSEYLKGKGHAGEIVQVTRQGAMGNGNPSAPAQAGEGGGKSKPK